VEIKRSLAGFARVLRSALPVCEWWYGCLGAWSVLLPAESDVTDPRHLEFSSHVEEVDEGSLRLRHSATVPGSKCIERYGDRHVFAFDPPLPRGYSDIGTCVRCGTRALIEVDGRTTPVPEHVFCRSVRGWLLGPLVLLVLGASLLACTDHRIVRRPTAPAPVETPSQKNESVTEQVMWHDPTYCPRQGCLGVTGFRANDGVLLAALILLYQYDEPFRPFLRAAAAKRTRVTWGDLPADVGGTFSASTDTITIASRFKGSALAEISSLLAHELVHFGQRHPAKSAAQCVSFEMASYAWQAQAYSVMPRVGRSSLASYLDGLERAWREQRLKSWVLAQPLYHVTCLGGSLPDY
jgi:hypothetical protein